MYQRETQRERDNRAADGWHAALIHLNLHILYRQFLFLCTQPERRGRSALIPFIRSSVTRRFDSTRQSNLIEIQWLDGTSTSKETDKASWTRLIHLTLQSRFPLLPFLVSFHWFKHSETELPASNWTDPFLPSTPAHSYKNPPTDNI